MSINPNGEDAKLNTNVTTGNTLFLIGIFAFIVGIFLMLSYEGKEGINSTTVLFAILILGGIVAFGIGVSILNREEKNNPRLLINHFIKVSVIECPNIPQGIEGIITMTNDKFTFKSDNFNNEIPTSKLISVSCANADQIINSNSFSVGRAIVGGAVFGALGGAIGGFSGNKSFIPKTMIVEYEENNTNKYMLFLQGMRSKDKISTLIDIGRYLEKECIKMNENLRKLKSKEIQIVEE